MAKKAITLPIGVSEVKNREGLYRFQITLHGKRHSEYYSLDNHETLKQSQRNSTLQKAIDEFRHKCETGTTKGAITDKSTVTAAYEWYTKQKSTLGTLRESTIITSDVYFKSYILPRFGHLPLKAVTSAAITDFFSDLLVHGGTSTRYKARPALIDKIKSSGNCQALAAEIGISRQGLSDIQDGKRKSYLTTAQKIADYFAIPLNKAFERVETKSPLEPTTVNRIYTIMSGLFKACVKHDIILKNPCTNAEKPKQNEKSAVFLDNHQLPLFQNALETIDNSNIRVGLLLCLWLGLRLGESRGLQWQNVCFEKNVIYIRTAANETKKGLALGKPKTERSDRMLPISPELRRILLEHKARQEENHKRLGSAYDNTLNLVCPNTSGGILNTDVLNNAVKQIAANTPELPPKLHTHSLRHPDVNPATQLFIYFFQNLKFVIAKPFSQLYNQRISTKSCIFQTIST
jgi:integrase